jgi:hypothetical protein
MAQLMAAPQGKQETSGFMRTRSGGPVHPGFGADSRKLSA